MYCFVVNATSAWPIRSSALLRGGDSGAMTSPPCPAITTSPGVCQLASFIRAGLLQWIARRAQRPSHHLAARQAGPGDDLWTRQVGRVQLQLSDHLGGEASSRWLIPLGKCPTCLAPAGLHNASGPRRMGKHCVEEGHDSKARASTGPRALHLGCESSGAYAQISWPSRSRPPPLRGGRDRSCGRLVAGRERNGYACTGQYGCATVGNNDVAPDGDRWLCLVIGSPRPPGIPRSLGSVP